MLKLLIFDLDGTLLDTSRDITDAVNYAVKPSGAGPLTVDTIKSMVGSGISSLIGELITPSAVSGGDITESKERALERFLEYYSERLLDHTVPYPGVKETLAGLAQYRKAVISNKREVLSMKVLEGTGLAEFFDVVLGSDSVSERKPSPVPVIEVLKRLHVSKDEAVMIGDSNYDIEAAKAAGVRTVAVTYGYRSRDMLKAADYMIDSFRELLALLPQINAQSSGRG